MDDDHRTLSQSVNCPVYYRYRQITPAGVDQELVVFVSFGDATISIEGCPREAAHGLPPDELRKLAGALLDAADAIDDSARTGVIKTKHIYR